MNNVKQYTGSPIEYGWLPHKPTTWTHKFAKLKKDVTMEYFTNTWKNGKPVMETINVNAGSMVKIVMVSRFGDVGITEQLDRQNGYGARVMLDELYDYNSNP